MIPNSHKYLKSNTVRINHLLVNRILYKNCKQNLTDHLKKKWKNVPMGHGWLPPLLAKVNRYFSVKWYNAKPEKAVKSEIKLGLPFMVLNIVYVY